MDISSYCNICAPYFLRAVEGSALVIGKPAPLSQEYISPA
jgi:hypothetical protein